MAATLITTLGGASANSYVDLDEAETYADTRLDADAWDGATAPRRIRALLQAARRLNDEHWVGDRVSATQALAWPRYNVLVPDGAAAWCGGQYYDTTEIPLPVRQAQIELAIAYLDGWTFDDGGDEAIVEEFEADGVRTKFGAANPRAGDLPATVARLLSGLLRGPEWVRG